MAVTKWFVVVAFVISFMAPACYAAKKARPFSDLQAYPGGDSFCTARTSFGSRGGQNYSHMVAKLELQAGAQDSAYKTVEAKLCYAPISQLNRPWRKTALDNIAKDKTCRFRMFSKPYAASNTTETYTVQMDVPSATYFIRVYA